MGLSNTRLAGFDLGSKLSTIARLAGLPVGRDTEIQTFGADIWMGPDGTRAENFKLIAPAIGELNGAGTVSAAHALNFKMRATLRASGGMLAAVGQNTSVPFVIVGTSSNPAFRPDVGAITSEQIKGLRETELGKKASGLLDGILGRRKRK
jgi:hypothetical protein